MLVTSTYRSRDIEPYQVCYLMIPVVYILQYIMLQCCVVHAMRTTGNLMMRQYLWYGIATYYQRIHTTMLWRDHYTITCYMYDCSSKSIHVNRCMKYFQYQYYICAAQRVVYVVMYILYSYSTTRSAFTPTHLYLEYFILFVITTCTRSITSPTCLATGCVLVHLAS